MTTGCGTTCQQAGGPSTVLPADVRGPPGPDRTPRLPSRAIEMQRRARALTARLCSVRPTERSSQLSGLRKRLRKAQKTSEGQLDCPCSKENTSTLLLDPPQCIAAELHLPDVVNSNRKRKRSRSPSQLRWRSPLPVRKQQRLVATKKCLPVRPVSPASVELARAPPRQHLRDISSTHLNVLRHHYQPLTDSSVGDHYYQRLDASPSPPPLRARRLEEAVSDLEEEDYVVMHPVMQERDYVNVDEHISSGCLSDVLNMKRFGCIERHMLELGNIGTASKNLSMLHGSVKKPRATGVLTPEKQIKATPVAEAFKKSNQSYKSSLPVVARKSQQTRQHETSSETSSQESIAATQNRRLPTPPVFGYNIDDINGFLSKAKLQTPANIPMVVTKETDLYVSFPPSSSSGEATVGVHMGLVVNALFKHRQWLFVQTPHNQEGYLVCTACTPLGIIPRQTSRSPWEDTTDVFPRRKEEVGCQKTQAVQVNREVKADNKTDAEKMYANLTRDGRSLGMLLLHLRSSPGTAGRVRPDEEAHTQSADEQPSRSRRQYRARHLSGNKEQYRVRHLSSTGPAVSDVTASRRRDPSTGRSRLASSDAVLGLGLSASNLAELGHSLPSAFQPLPHCASLTAKSLECLRQSESVKTAPAKRQVAPRSNNKVVVADNFDGHAQHTLTVKRGDIVVLLNTSKGDWYWVKDSLAREGYIPRSCVRTDFD